MSLTEIIIKQTKPREKVFMISDGRGLSLEVHPNGKKYWIIRYWINNKERRTSAGIYPEVSLKQARDKNYEFRQSLKTGKPIGFDKETFAIVAEEWYEKRMLPKVVESYLRVIRLRLDRLILPHIGHMKLEDLNSGLILQLCRKIEDKGTIETASRVKTMIGQVFNYAIATSRIDINPTLALQGALQSRKVKHHAAITEPAKIGILMRQIESYPYNIVRCALKFSALVFCRPGEIRRGEWTEIDWQSREWRIPAEKMKMDRPHVAPLADQTIELLKELQIHTGRDRWLFPSARDDGRCMSENAVRVALRSMGYGNDDMTAHGFRRMASTTLHNNNFPSDHIEIQLAHAEKNAVKKAYNHAEYLPQRREMMQWYADWLDNLKKQVSD